MNLDEKQVAFGHAVIGPTDEKQVMNALEFEHQNRDRPVYLYDANKSKANAGPRKASYKSTAINLFKGLVGSGVIALPYSFQKGGYVMSAIVFLAISLIINYTQTVFVLTSEFLSRKGIEVESYFTLVLHVAGPKSAEICRFFIILLQWGCCISYMIFFMKFFEFAFYNSDEPSLKHQIVYLAFAFCIIIPMIFFNDFAVFTRINAIANLFVILTLLLVTYYAISSIQQGSPQFKEEESNAFNISHIQTVIGVSIYAYESINILLDVRNSMKKKEAFKRLIQLVTLTTVCIYIVFATLATLGFGKNINQIVLFSMPQNNFVVSLAQVCYAVALAISFPLQLLPAFHLIEQYQIIREFTQNSLGRRTLTRFAQVVIISLIATIIPEFAVFLAIVGGLSGTVLQFVYPLYCFFKTVHEEFSPLERVVYISSCSTGIILGIYAGFGSIIELVLD